MNGQHPQLMVSHHANPLTRPSLGRNGQGGGHTSSLSQEARSFPTLPRGAENKAAREAIAGRFAWDISSPPMPTGLLLDRAEDV